MTEVPRLEVARAMSRHQRKWFEDLRTSVAQGVHYAICCSDEFEEFFHLLDMPTVVVNYWHNLVVRHGEKDYYTHILQDRGYDYDGLTMGPLGYATALSPERAPWGGLPKPTIMLGSTRDEAEFRFMELWAREYDCPFYPLEFNLAGRFKKIPPDGWWRDLRTNWRSHVDPAQLALRVDQTRHLISHLEQLTGRTISLDDVARSLALVNEQMDLMGQALSVVATADRCPASLRDQLAMYQNMWHRGTEFGRDNARRYRDEVVERAKAGVCAYPNEQRRLLYWSGLHEPQFHAYLQQQYGAVFVASLYSACPPLYAREFDPTDPLPAICSRNLFLLTQENPAWMVDVARRWRCDGIVAFDPSARQSTIDQVAAEAAGIPYVHVPHLGNDEELRRTLDEFMEKVI